MKQIFVLICLINAALAQQPGIPAPASSRARPERTPPAGIDPNTGQPIMPQEPAVRMDIDFPGGPPEMLLDVMQQVSGQKFNVIVHPDTAKYQLPAFKLRDVTAAQVFLAMNALGEPNFANGYWQRVPLPDGEIWTLTAQRGQPAGYLAGFVPPPANQQPQQAKQCRVFNLSQVLEDYSIEDVTTAVQAAWDLMGGRDAGDIKFHKDTKLLIAFGNSQQVTVLQEVLSELRNNVLNKRASEKPKTVPTAEPKKL